MKPFAAVIAAILGAATLAGCLLGDRCGPGEDLIGNACVPSRSDGGAPDGVTPDGGTSTDGDLSGLGEPCGATEDCTLAADMCVIYPGAAVGYCTVQHCSPEPDDCPVGYFCMNVSEYNPDYDTICIQE
jgi:hypothetical protein